MTTAPIVLNVGKAVGNTASGYTEPVPQRLRPRRPREGERLRWRWEGDRRRPHMWKIELAGGRDAASWFDFLTSLPGEPEWIVTDGDQAVKLAIEQLWHNRPVHYSCEGHLKNGFLDYARADGLSPVAADALWSDAMSGVPGWWALVQRVAELPDDATGTRDWIRRNHADVLEQMGKRRPGFPRGIGALEADNERLKEWIGGRRKTFENVRRTNLTLALMRAQLAGHAHPAAYTEIVRRIIPTISRTWKHGPKVVDWRRYQDRNGHKGVIEMAEDAAVRGAVALADYNVRAKRKSVASLLGEVNEYRAMIGFPPLALTPSGSAVSVKGQRLKDRPELLARVGLRAQRRSRSDNAASVPR